MSIGVGTFAGLVLFARLLVLPVVPFRCLADEEGAVKKPKPRLSVLILGSCSAAVGLLWYGWWAQVQLHWIMPISGMALIELGTVGTFVSIQLYLRDCLKVDAHSAFFAASFFRDLVGGCVPLAGPTVYRALGLGWGNSLLALIGLLMVPGVMLFYRCSQSTRKSSR